VDEAQDSSPQDFDIYRTIKAEQKIYLADPDQSIYGFRGADPMGLVMLARGAVTDGRNQAAW
jgi:ATP-dependent exoDNAse (exonuclease V) beta subunit